MLEQLSALGGLIDMQTQSFAAFNERLLRAERDVHNLQTETYDRVVAYVDKQVAKHLPYGLCKRPLTRLIIDNVNEYILNTFVISPDACIRSGTLSTISIRSCP